jgi:hypothetical protein
MYSAYLMLEMVKCSTKLSILLTFFKMNSPIFQARGMNYSFYLPLEHIEPVAVLTCYFCNKNYVCNVKWKESRLFRGVKKSYDSVIFQMLECPLIVKKNLLLVQICGEHFLLTKKL